jgi:hypothetical protein
LFEKRFAWSGEYVFQLIGYQLSAKFLLPVPDARKQRLNEFGQIVRCRDYRACAARNALIGFGFLFPTANVIKGKAFVFAGIGFSGAEICILESDAFGDSLLLMLLCEGLPPTFSMIEPNSKKLNRCT